MALFVVGAARGDFLVFVLFEAAALIFSLVVCLRLAYLRTRRGAGLMALAQSDLARSR